MSTWEEEFPTILGIVVPKLHNSMRNEINELLVSERKKWNNALEEWLLNENRSEHISAIYDYLNCKECEQ